MRGWALQGTASKTLLEAEVLPCSPSERLWTCPTAESEASLGKALTGLNFVDDQKCTGVGKQINTP